VAVAKLLDERNEKYPAATRVVVREPETKAPAAMVTGVEKHMNKQTSDHEDVFWRSPPPGCRTLNFGAEFGRPTFSGAPTFPTHPFPSKNKLITSGSRLPAWEYLGFVANIENAIRQKDKYKRLKTMSDDRDKARKEKEWQPLSA